MKYFIVNTTIYDGEYQYLSQSPVEAESEKEAIRLQEEDAKEWTSHGYREYDIDIHREITKEEYDVINKYIY